MTCTDTRTSFADAKAAASKRLDRAKSDLMLDFPFYASMICNMEVVISETTQSGRLETDGEKIWVDPWFIAELPQDQVTFCLCHEVMHGVFTHMFRRGARDPDRWNRAGDYLINGILRDEEKMAMWPRALYDPALVKKGGETTEGIYELLQEQAQNGGGMPGGSDGEGGALDYHIDAKGDAAERSEREAKMKVSVAQAAQAAKMCGNLSAGIARLVDMALRPQLDWKEILRDFVTTRSKVEYSYARPKRRHWAEGLYLPSQSGETMGDIMVAVDMSGSISEKEANEFIAELRGIKEDAKPRRVHVLYFESKVAGYEMFEQDDDLDCHPTGCGGTAFSPIFRYVTDNDIEPVCGVVLTDLYCNDFGDPPDYPVLWISNSPKTDAPWGQVVKMHHHL